MSARAHQASPRDESVTVGRIMSFSDAVFAVAITLLIPNINVPDIPEGQVGSQLGPAIRQLLPHFRSFLISASW